MATTNVPPLLIVVEPVNVLAPERTKALAAAPGVPQVASLVKLKFS